LFSAGLLLTVVRSYSERICIMHLPVHLHFTGLIFLTSPAHAGAEPSRR